MSDCITIGTNLEPFLDSFLWDRFDGAQLRLHEPVRREIVIEADRPFESPVSGCYHLFEDGDRIRLYYRGHFPLGSEDRDHSSEQTANLAESEDGVHFVRPELGLVEFRGSRRNNIVWRGIEGHNMFVFRDENPSCAPDERYKAIGGPWEKLYGLASTDGINWRHIREAPLEIAGAFDSLNVAFWDRLRGCYRMFSRYYERLPDGREVRAIQSCESDDFVRWSKPRPHRYGDGVPWEHFYTNATIPCPGAEHILLAFPKRFVPERDPRESEGMAYPGKGVSDAVFMSSRDGEHWDRTFLEAWARPGPDRCNWTHRGNMPARGIIETSPGEWSMYISEHYGWPTNRLRRLTMRRHGISSLHAGASGGEAVTRPLVLDGDRLCLNYSTSAAGSVQVELQDERGEPLPGHGVDDVVPMFGDELDGAVAWKGGDSLRRLRGSPARFRFRLRDADVFAMQLKSAAD